MQIKVSEMNKIVEDNAISKNIDMIFPVVANDLCFVPFFAEPITEFYKANKFELYEIAKNSPYYNYKIFGDKRLFSEITMRRIFAVILIAKERDDAKELFISLIGKSLKSILSRMKTTRTAKMICCCIQAAHRRLHQWISLIVTKPRLLTTSAMMVLKQEKRLTPSTTMPLCTRAQERSWHILLCHWTPADPIGLPR